MVIGTLHFSIYIFGFLVYYFFCERPYSLRIIYVLMVVRVLNGYAGERFITIQVFVCVSRSHTTTYVYVQAKKKAFAKIEDVRMTTD